jgi:hypothetical protein
VVETGLGLVEKASLPAMTAFTAIDVQAHMNCAVAADLAMVMQSLQRYIDWDSCANKLTRNHEAISREYLSHYHYLRRMRLRLADVDTHDDTWLDCL